MTKSNLKRLLKLADDIFAVKDDATQLEVDPGVIVRLMQIHPATLSEFDDGDGPVAWVLMIPTTLDLMERFLKEEITEKQLYELTQPERTYEALYLCSALVLEEYRRQGITKKITLQAIEEIRRVHPIQALFVWPFSPEGDKAAESIARLVELPLHKRVYKK